MTVEEEFSSPSRKIAVLDEDAGKLTTVQGVIDYLKDLGVEDK
jgi:hypothetical protein